MTDKLADYLRPYIGDQADRAADVLRRRGGIAVLAGDDTIRAGVWKIVDEEKNR